MHSLKPYRHEQNFGSVRAVYGRQPSCHKGEQPCISEPHSIDIAFLENKETLVRRLNGPTYARHIRAGTGGLHGGEPLEFVSVRGSAEFLELVPSLEIRTTAADYFRAPSAVHFDAIEDIEDQVLWAVSSRFRAHVLQGWLLNETEAEELIRTLVGHLICSRLGGRLPRNNDSRLSARSLADIRDYVEASLQEKITVSKLAEVANRSTHHFMRTFSLTTGMKPHEFVRAIRMERAKEAIIAGRRVKDAAKTVGYVPGHSFREAFCRYFGVLPSNYSETVLCR